MHVFSPVVWVIIPPRDTDYNKVADKVRNALLLTRIPVKNLPNVPADVVCVWIIGLPLRKTDFSAVEPHEPFLKAC